MSVIKEEDFVLQEPLTNYIISLRTPVLLLELGIHLQGNYIARVQSTSRCLLPYESSASVCQLELLDEICFASLVNFNKVEGPVVATLHH